LVDIKSGNSSVTKVSKPSKKEETKQPQVDTDDFFDDKAPTPPIENDNMSISL
jgi:hypothetical protein